MGQWFQENEEELKGKLAELQKQELVTVDQAVAVVLKYVDLIIVSYPDQISENVLSAKRKFLEEFLPHMFNNLKSFYASYPKDLKDAQDALRTQILAVSPIARSELSAQGKQPSEFYVVTEADAELLLLMKEFFEFVKPAKNLEKYSSEYFPVRKVIQREINKKLRSFDAKLAAWQASDQQPLPKLRGAESVVEVPLTEGDGASEIVAEAGNVQMEKPQDGEREEQELRGQAQQFTTLSEPASGGVVMRVDGVDEPTESPAQVDVSEEQQPKTWYEAKHVAIQGIFEKIKKSETLSLEDWLHTYLLCVDRITRFHKDKVPNDEQFRELFSSQIGRLPDHARIGGMFFYAYTQALDKPVREQLIDLAKNGLDWSTISTFIGDRFNSKSKQSSKVVFPGAIGGAVNFIREVAAIFEPGTKSELLVKSYADLDFLKITCDFLLLLTEDKLLNSLPWKFKAALLAFGQDKFKALILERHKKLRERIIQEEKHLVDPEVFLRERDQSQAELEKMQRNAEILEQKEIEKQRLFDEAVEELAPLGDLFTEVEPEESLSDAGDTHVAPPLSQDAEEVDEGLSEQETLQRQIQESIRRIEILLAAYHQRQQSSSVSSTHGREDGEGGDVFVDAPEEPAWVQTGDGVEGEDDGESEEAMRQLDDETDGSQLEAVELAHGTEPQEWFDPEANGPKPLCQNKRIQRWLVKFLIEPEKEKYLLGLFNECSNAESMTRNDYNFICENIKYCVEGIPVFSLGIIERYKSRDNAVFNQLFECLDKKECKLQDVMHFKLRQKAYKLLRHGLRIEHTENSYDGLLFQECAHDLLKEIDSHIQSGGQGLEIVCRQVLNKLNEANSIKHRGFAKSLVLDFIILLADFFPKFAKFMNMTKTGDNTYSYSGFWAPKSHNAVVEVVGAVKDTCTQAGLSTPDIPIRGFSRTSAAA